MHIGGIRRLVGVSGGDAGCRYHYGSNLLSLLQFFSVLSIFRPLLGGILLYNT